MVFRQYFGAVKTVLVSIIIAGALAIVGVDISLLVGNKYITQSPAVAIISMIAAILIVLFAVLMLANSFYKLKDDHLFSCLGFFIDKIKYDEIVGVKQNSETSDIYLIVKGNPVKGNLAFRMNLKKDKIDSFLEKLKDKCPNAVVETFEPNKKK